jgi:plastocyanin
LPVFLSLISEKKVKASIDAAEFKPNPIHVKAGYTISWINTDNNSHTVTFGKGPTDPKRGKKFDSCLSGITALTKEGKVFEHKFNSVGEFPYFCQLHPSKVGKVIVHRNKIKNMTINSNTQSEQVRHGRTAS